MLKLDEEWKHGEVSGRAEPTVRTSGTDQAFRGREL